MQMVDNCFVKSGRGQTALGRQCDKVEWQKCGGAAENSSDWKITGGGSNPRNAPLLQSQDEATTGANHA